LRRLQAENPIAGVLSLWLNECALVGKYACRANPGQHFTWVLGQDAKPENHYVRRIKPDGRQVIAMSDFLKNELARNWGINARCVANNGINEEIFPELNISDRPYDILGAGSLIALKNYAAFVEIVGKLKLFHPRLKTAIAGDGPEKARLAAQIESVGLKGTVQLLGGLPHGEVLRLMNQARIFLHPSVYEGNSTVLMEALYAGCHAVSFCGLADTPVENLHTCQSQEEMVATIEPLLATPGLPVKRVIFNRMADTVRKIAALYD
jgi:glycosyltransferase involved in cell wall biosynthesis